MVVTRGDRIALGILLLGGWVIGTMLSLTADSSPMSLSVNAAGTVGAAVAMTGVVRADPAWAWAGTGGTVIALLIGAVVPEWAIWPAGVCWVFVLVAGFTASYADTALDGALEAVAGGIAVLPVVPLALSEPGLWIVAFLAAGAVNVAIMFGHRHRTAERRLEATRTEVQMTERTAMARDLHDVIAHEVTGIVVLAQAGIAAGADTDGTLARIERSGARALADIRAMVGTLRTPGDAPSMLAPSASGSFGLRAALTDVERDGLDVSIDPDADADDVPDLVRLVAHRVVTEGLTNARRHAPGGRVRVRVARDDGRLEVAVVDDGAAPGAPPGPGPGNGVGLVGLVERAATAGGSVSYGPEGDGWRLTATLPLQALPLGDPR
ncbi:sensor histidine kinase [Tsukamurella sp. 1534]|uniref:sensor histidine kinase n=1 Tax=Tsukamurella sp. 1534 TaxID=1151061 RepID=UPI0002F9E2A9|nr:histidine kinase [Tsukamurella sp. 1534]